MSAYCKSDRMQWNRQPRSGRRCRRFRIQYAGSPEILHTPIRAAYTRDQDNKYDVQPIRLYNRRRRRKPRIRKLFKRLHSVRVRRKLHIHAELARTVCGQARFSPHELERRTCLGQARRVLVAEKPQLSDVSSGRIPLLRCIR